MTDKDIKDYCKNCDVEPPAMRFKCPECEHNPDNENNLAKDINVPHKEQIIIDGIDVSGCKYYKHNDENSGWSSCISKDEEHIHAVNPLCCEKEDCLFKQLARKTQECNELKIENEELNNRMAEVTYRATGGRLSYSNYTLDAIEQAFNDQLEILSDQKLEEEIKELNQKLYLVQNEVHFKTEYIQEQREEIKQLEQECEELKRKVELMMDCADCKVDKYKQALDEIEKELKEDIYCENQECGCDDFEECLKCTKEHILDIINKAKGEGNV